MKKKFLAIVSIIIVITLAACGSAEPTMSAEDLANTAVADAWIAITQTQAALPTATPIPPTNTAEPTVILAPTLPPLPTLTAPTEAVPTADVCGKVLSDFTSLKGTLATVEFVNNSQGRVDLAFGMNSPNEFGECITYSFSLGMGDTVSTKILNGCYWGWGWINGSDPSQPRTGDALLCLPDSLPIYRVVITKETVTLK